MRRLGGAPDGVRLAEAQAEAVELVGHVVARGRPAPEMSVRERLRHVFSYRDTRALVFIFVATQILDAGTTAYALQTGRFREGNPIFGTVVDAQQYLVYSAMMYYVLVVLIANLLHTYHMT